jgi:phosphoribosylaminoimidazole (AIR) synthetase
MADKGLTVGGEIAEMPEVYRGEDYDLGAPRVDFSGHLDLAG